MLGSKILPQASLRRTSDLLPLVSLHIFNKIDIHKSNKTNVCISFQYIQIYRDGSTFSAGQDFLSAA